MTPLSRDTAKPSELPEHVFSPIWVDHAMPAEATDSFSAWLDGELERLESRYRHYWTRCSVIKSLNR